MQHFLKSKQQFIISITHSLYCLALSKDTSILWIIKSSPDFTVLVKLPGLHSTKVLITLEAVWSAHTTHASISFTPHCPRISETERKRSFVVKNRSVGLPWWRSGWESACQCRGHGFDPWSGRIPHATEQLSPWATTTEPARLEPVLRNERGHDNERPAHRDEEWPLLAATRESPRTETKTQHSHK